MRYHPFPTHIKVVWNTKGKYSLGLHVPFQPWLSGQVVKGSETLPLIPADGLVVEVKTAEGPCIIKRGQFQQIMQEVIEISEGFYSQSFVPCYLKVHASGEITCRYGNESATLLGSNHLVFEASRLCIDLKEEGEVILGIPPTTQLGTYPRELLQTTSDRVRQMILEKIR